MTSFDHSLFLYLTNEEKTMLSLRALYRENGYDSFKMSQFEDYDLYVKNKDFLIGDSVMTFTDTEGRLLALKPDVTLSIVKNFKGDRDTLSKYCYNERIYRFSKEKHSFTELLQSGIECLGTVDLSTMTEVIDLAVKSLKTIGNAYILELSHIAIIRELVSAITSNAEEQAKIFEAISAKNFHELSVLCADSDAELYQALQKILSLRGTPSEVLNEVLKMNLPKSALNGISELGEVCNELTKNHIEGIVLDFSLVSDIQYYSGILFRGFVHGVPERVLSGGRYDHLMDKMGKQGDAIGFAVYLNTIERFERENGGQADE